MKYLGQILSQAATEEEVKFLFAKFFKLKPDTKNFIDLYTPQILFEFKFDSPLKNIQIRAKIVAQTLYYVRRLKFGRDYRPVSQNICIVTKNSAAIFKTETFSAFYDDDKSYDWDLAPSSPCKKLIAALADFKPLIDAQIYDFDDTSVEIKFSTRINDTIKEKSCEIKQINELNFEQVFNYWKKLFGKAVANGRKPSEYFITDIELGKSENLSKSVLFRMTGGELVEKSIKPEKYHEFWDFYAKIASAQEIIAIRQKMDRMTEENLRRRTGEFYTPLAFADKAADYITRTVGNWWLDDNFRLWDMAAGTGNLEFHFSAEMLKKCYISTLIDDDANYCASIFDGATVFQYDFLNDNADKLPENLRADLANPKIKWIIYINPPYATANNKQLTNRDINKNNVSMTEICKQMTAEGMGEVSRELFSQFLYRISKDFADRQAWLGIFSTPKYINSSNDQTLRNNFFHYRFERGFVFSSRNFQGCSGNFSISFMIWDLSEQISIESQEILLDVYNNSAEKVAEKIFKPAHREEFLNNWIERPLCTKKFPPMSGALNVAAQNKDRRDRIAENFLASLTIKGNEFSNQTYTSILPAPRTCPSTPLFLELPDELLGAEVLRRDQSFELLRRAKLFLSLRSFEDFESLLGLDWRRVWNKENPNRPVVTLLDLFTSVKYAHECILPLTARLRRRGIDPSSVNWKGSPWGRRALLQVSQEKNSLFFDAAKVISHPDVPTSGDLFREEYVDVVAAEKDGNTTVRIDDICRSHSIWLDPVDAPKELYKWRLRVQKAICWAYANDCVPVMMTLTIFHRWHYLADLLRVLQKSWDKFIVSGRPAARRKEAMGLEGYVRRLEITINDGLENSLDGGEFATNSGWHPHFHVILFVPKDKFETLSDIEFQLKNDWVDIVSEQFRLERVFTSKK